MCCEDLLIAFCLLLLSVERSKEIRNLWYGVVGPLPTVLGEERVREAFGFWVAGAAVALFLQSGWAVQSRSGWHAWDFDATRGFPGEDINLF